MNKKKLYILLVYLIHFAVGFSQTTPIVWKPDNEVVFYTYPALPCKIGGFSQDKYGYIWIGSTDGLYRFDGDNFKRYVHEKDNPKSLASNSCFPYLADSHGMLWIKTVSGLSILNTSTYIFRNFNYSDTLFNDFVSGVVEDNTNTIWISSSGRKNLTKYEQAKDKFTTFTVPDSLYIKNMRTFDLAQSKVGFLYIATDNGVLTFNILNENFGKRIPGTFPGYGDKLVFWPTQCLWTSKDGTLYTGYWNSPRGIIPIGVKPKESEFTKYTNILVDDNFYNTSIITQKSDSELWVGTSLGGLFVFNTNSKKYVSIQHQPDNPLSFPDEQNPIISHIFKDKSGCTWFNVGNKIVKADPYDQLVKSYDIRKLCKIDPKTEFNLNSVVKVKDQNKLFIGTWDAAGLYEVDLKNNTLKVNKTYRDKNQKECGIQEIIKDHNGDYLAISQFQIMKYDKIKGKFIPLKVYPDFPVGKGTNFSLTSVLEDSHGHLWMGTYMHGVYDYNPEDHICTHYSKKLYNPIYIGSDIIKPCFEDKDGNIWFSSFDGIFTFIRKNRSFICMSYKPNDKSYNDGRDLIKDKKGNIWRSSVGGGLQKYNSQTGMFDFVSTNVDTRQITLDGMTEDNRGYIWMSTDEEICRFDPIHNQFLFPKQAMHLEMGARIVGFCNEDGTLYTSDGTTLYETNTNLFNGNTQLPDIVFNNFKVLNRDTVFSENLNDINEITLPYNKNFISIEFAALNFSHSENNQYAYKLEGVDNDWVMSGNKNEASYSNLDPGKYVFYVKASNNTGLWNEKGKSLIIIITPPWWQTWWFRICVVMVIIVTLLLGIRLYTRRKLRIYKTEFEKQQALDQERTRISRDLHDEVGSTLSSINIIANMDEKSAMHPEEKLYRIKNQTHTVLEKMSEIIWMMNPANNSLENIFTHIKEYASELLEAKNIEFGFVAKGDISAIHIPMEQRRDLYLIMKEAINNLAKYSACSQAILQVTIENGNLIIKVTDNGIGFDDVLKSSGNGLVNMRKRAEGLNAQFQIDSVLNSGTCISLIMPIA
ncbi:MAG: triple tyrosine motif-containing protein [Bacteroidota bacterium]